MIIQNKLKDENYKIKDGKLIFEPLNKMKDKTNQKLGLENVLDPKWDTEFGLEFENKINILVNKYHPNSDSKGTISQKNIIKI